MKKWVILVSQMVRGKSKAPERLKSGGVSWKRHKPYHYRDASKDHEILYSRSFSATDANALAEVKRVNDKMFNVYVSGMGNTEHYCIKDYSIVLHNCSDDVAKKPDGSDFEATAKLWEHRRDSQVSNYNLVTWGVISGNPTNRSYKILSSLQRKVT